MKLINRERVDGTQITIGKRVYYKNGKKIVAATFSAEYTGSNGKQLCRSLETGNVAQARRKAIKVQEESLSRLSLEFQRSGNRFTYSTPPFP